MDILDGKVAVVTGAGRGIGRAHALALAAAGAKVVVNDVGLELTEDEGGKGLDRSRPAAPVAQQVVNEITGAGGKAVADTTDVGTIASAKGLIAKALEAFGDIHILVNNAGTWNESTTFDLDDARFDAEFATHVKGTMGATSAAVSAMREAGHGGRIINTIAGGFAGDGGMAIYMSAKSAIASFTATAAVECEPLGILVNGISPLAITRQSRAYFFRTGTVSKDDTATISHLGPHQNSPLVVYLASDASAGVTGRLFSIYPEAFSPTSAIALREQWWEVGESVTRPGWSVTDLERVIPTLIHRPRSTFGRSVADPNALQRG